jgi:dihydrofolate reductase
MKVFLIAAISVDGYIARSPDQPADWTSNEDKKLFVRLTKEAGWMVMGSRTYATIGRALPGRQTIIYTNHPETLTGTNDPAVQTTNEDPAELVKRLSADGVEQLAVCGGAQIYRMFAAAGLLDELYLTVEPQAFGTGISLFDAQLDLRLELMDDTKLNEDVILLHYRVVK